MAFGRRRESLLSRMWRQVTSEEAAAIVAAMDDGATQAAQALVSEAGVEGKEVMTGPEVESANSDSS